MKILVASTTKGPKLPTDFNLCVEGEVVYLQAPCDTDRLNPDGGCGCGRAFAGTNSHGGTTTARVVESSMTAAELREALRASLEASGWLDPRWTTASQRRNMINGYLETLHRITQHFPVGALVRRRVDTLYEDRE